MKLRGLSQSLHTLIEKEKSHKSESTVNITMKAHCLEALYPEPAQMFSSNLEKFAKAQGQRP